MNARSQHEQRDRLPQAQPGAAHRRGRSGLVTGLVAGLALGGSASMMVAANHRGDEAAEALNAAASILESTWASDFSGLVEPTEFVGGLQDGAAVTFGVSDHHEVSPRRVKPGRWDPDDHDWHRDRRHRDHRRRSWLDDRHQYFAVPGRFKLDRHGNAVVEEVDLWMRPAGQRSLRHVKAYDRD